MVRPPHHQPHMKTVLPLLVSCVSVVAGSTPAKLVLLGDSFNAARCLDGSPGGYFYRPGRGANASKFVILLQGEEDTQLK